MEETHFYTKALTRCELNKSMIDRNLQGRWLSDQTYWRLFLTIWIILLADDDKIFFIFSLDQLLGGGLYSKEVTEIYGSPAVGKTQV